MEIGESADMTTQGKNKNQTNQAKQKGEEKVVP